jgi:hypothetical protein
MEGLFRGIGKARAGAGASESGWILVHLLQVALIGCRLHRIRGAFPTRRIGFGLQKP